MRRHLTAALLAAAVAILLAPAAASAYSFSNDAEITIPDQGQASPYPSTIHVQGVKGPVVDVQVGLIGVTHSSPRDLDVLLVPPDGHGVVLMSDVCGANPVSNFTWLFRSTGNWPVMGTTCGGLSYTNSNMPGEPDHWPNATGGGDYNLTDWHRKAMNGDWNLYVVDDHPGGSGKIARGWTLQLTTGPVASFVPAIATVGVAEHYPLTTAVDGHADEVISDVKVALPNIAHDRPSDLNLLLVGPQGQNVMLMAGACANSTLDGALLFDEHAPAPLPQDASGAGCGPSARPADYRPAASLPQQAPPGPYGTSLDEFAGTSPNGDWKLFATDVVDGGNGYIGQPFRLDFTTRAKATVHFAETALTVPEGGTQSVTITRAATGTLGPADVRVTTAPGSADAGADFTPIATTVHFDHGESEKTVLLDAIDDGTAEPAESYTVKLSEPTGDAQVDSRSQLDVTIPASAGKPDTRPQPLPIPLPRCDGKPATIVGTPGRDILRGTPRADVIVGLGGNDKIAAVKGNDTVCGGAGSDTIAGGAGRDRLVGGPGNDRLTGGAGRDTCLGGRGRNRVTCERKAAR